MKAIISVNPQARFFHQPERVEAIDITHVLSMIIQLVKISDAINDNPTQFPETSQVMAYIIDKIKKSVNIPPNIQEELCRRDTK